MPETVTKTFEIYTIEELQNEAREHALNVLRESDLYAWSGEWIDSIRTFCEYFGVYIKHWNIGPWCPVDYTIGEYLNANFRGLKLSQFNPDHMPTGFCGDCAVWGTFHSEFKRTGDAKYAFEQAVHAGFVGWRDDWEASLSDSALVEWCEANDYRFTANGSFYS